MKLASAAYPITWHEDWASFEAKTRAWVGAVQADLLVFPEYGWMELASLEGAEAAGDLARMVIAVAKHLDRALALMQDLARAQGCYILTPSAPYRVGGRPVNRAWMVGPDGLLGHQDKQIMTPWEAAPWGIVPGGPLEVFDLAGVKVGVLICYDSEFPLLARHLVEAGVEVILCPSCTETPSGAARVRIAAQARALEGQCLTVSAPLIGAAPWCPPVEVNLGQAGIFAPADSGFSDTGILARGPWCEEGWTVAEVDLAALAKLRDAGEVRLRRDWLRQSARLSG